MRKQAGKPHITIIGAGLGGCFLAYNLGKLGYKIDVYEHRSDFRKFSSYAGKSFNLTLYFRGINAMRKAGVWSALQKIIVPVRGNVIHMSDTKTHYDPYEHTDKQVLYTVHREELNKALLNKAESLKNVTFHFDTRALSVDRANKAVLLQNRKTGKVVDKKTDLLVGADGVNSVIRNEIQRGQNADHVQEYSDWGYKEVRISPEKVAKLGMKYFSTHTWPRPNTLIIAFPNPDKSFTLMFNLPLKGPNSFATLKTKTAVETFIKTHFNDVQPVLSEIADSFLNKPIGSFVSIYTTPWYYQDFMVLLGDAAHGVLPFYGQGMCSAFEDVMVFTELIKRHNADFAVILPEFQELRKRNTDVLADLSKENFIELRDKARSSVAIAQDKLVSGLHRIAPNFFVPPLYKLIAHDTMPYADAYEKYRRQQRIAKGLGLGIAAGVLALPLLIRRKLVE